MNDGIAYIIVEELKASIAKIEFSLSLSNEKLWDELGFLTVAVAVNGNSYLIPVDDEYDNPITANKPVQLHMVLRTLEDFEESQDFLQWCNDMGIDATSITALHLYRHLTDVCPLLREIWGVDARPLSSFDIQMNTGAMQLLRAGS